MQELEGREEFPTPVHSTHQGSQQEPARPDQYRTEGETSAQCLPVAETSCNDEFYPSGITTSSVTRSLSPTSPSLTSPASNMNLAVQWIEPKTSDVDDTQQPNGVVLCHLNPVSPLSSQQPPNLDTSSSFMSGSFSPLSPCDLLDRVSPLYSPLINGTHDKKPKPASLPAAPSALPSLVSTKSLVTGLSKGIPFPQQSETWSIQPCLGRPSMKIK